jgi:hypothetical protein
MIILAVSQTQKANNRTCLVNTRRQHLNLSTEQQQQQQELYIYHLRAVLVLHVNLLDALRHNARLLAGIRRALIRGSSSSSRRRARCARAL